MVKEPTTNTIHTVPALDRFNLDFEYNISWHEAKKAVRIRTLK